ncbi:unnamed protein product [Amaranthus hypochondriacus]
MRSSITIPPNTDEDEQQQVKASLPKEVWFNSYPMYFYQDCWNIILDSTISCQNHFLAHPSDIFIASIPKTGTTWLKSLLFSIINRKTHPISQSSLLKHNPHELIPQLESIIYANPKYPDLKILEKSPRPRLLGTHLPFQSLPTSIKDTNCKIVYICRNPFDTFISSWLFYLNYDENHGVNQDMMEGYFDKFCEGKFPFGPFEEHVLGYWKESLKNKEKILFVKFEDLKKDCKGELKRLGEFVGYPFSMEEQKEGVIDDIIKLCSIERLKDVEANRNGRVYSFIENKWFFRKGEVGDWVNYLSPSMVEKFEKIMDEKFSAYGLKV